MAYLTKQAPGCNSLRLFQDGFNPDSFGLYTQLGFAVRDVAPYLLAVELQPPARATSADIRPGRPEDRLALEELKFFSATMTVLGVYPAHPFRKHMPAL